jgi:hypothetical protein
VLTKNFKEKQMYGNVCTASNWWVKTAIDVIFVMAIIGVTLWIAKLCTGIYTSHKKHRA